MALISSHENLLFKANSLPISVDSAVAPEVWSYISVDLGLQAIQSSRVLILFLTCEIVTLNTRFTENVS